MACAAFLLAFVPSLVFWFDVVAGPAYYTAFLFFAVFTVFNIAFGVGYPRNMANAVVGERLAAFLLWLPPAVGVVWLVSVVSLPFVLGNLGLHEWLALFLALWIYGSITTAAAHDLMHSMDRWSAVAGRLVFASVGYFWYVEDHRAHHAVSPLAADEDAAARDESVYRYFLRSTWASLRRSVAWSAARQGKFLGLRPLAWSAMIPMLLASIWVVVLGWAGLLAYVALCASVIFSIRTITFLQHWGLASAAEIDGTRMRAWDSRCLLMSLMLFNINHHQQHHERPRTVYWRNDSPDDVLLVMPASYPSMFWMALWPPLLRRVMGGRLDKVLSSLSSGRNYNDQSSACLFV